MYNQFLAALLGGGPKCAAMFTAGAFEVNRAPGMDNTEFGEFSFSLYSAKKPDASPFRGVRILDWCYSHKWVDASMALALNAELDYLYFTLHGPQCLRTINFACNEQWYPGKKRLAASLGISFWQELFAKKGVATEPCGPGNLGVRPKGDRDYEFLLAPSAMTEGPATFSGRAQLAVKARPAVEFPEQDRSRVCFVRPNSSVPKDSYLDQC